MKILVPITQGGERSGEPQYTSTEWDNMSPKQRLKALSDIKQPKKGVSFEFTRDEALRLQDAGRFNGPQIGGFAKNLLGVRTETFVDGEGDIMVKLLAQFNQDTKPTLPNNTLVGTIFPIHLIRSLDTVIMTGSGPVSQ